MLFPRDLPKECDKSESSSVNYEASLNMIFVGYLCVQGDCMGLVVATGCNTLIAEKLRTKQWPPSKIITKKSTFKN